MITEVRYGKWHNGVEEKVLREEAAYSLITVTKEYSTTYIDEEGNEQTQVEYVDEEVKIPIYVKNQLPENFIPATEADYITQEEEFERIKSEFNIKLSEQQRVALGIE